MPAPTLIARIDALKALAWEQAKSLQGMPDCDQDPAYRLAEFAFGIATDLQHGNALVQKFVARLEADPSAAFEWSEDAQVAAAKMSIYSYWIEQMDDVITCGESEPAAHLLELMKKEMTRQFMAAAGRAGSGSSSLASNAQASYRLSVLKQVVERMASF